MRCDINGNKYTVLLENDTVGIIGGIGRYAVLLEVGKEVKGYEEIDPFLFRKRTSL